MSGEEPPQPQIYFVYLMNGEAQIHYGQHYRDQKAVPVLSRISIDGRLAALGIDELRKRFPSPQQPEKPRPDGSTIVYA